MIYRFRKWLFWTIVVVAPLLIEIESPIYITYLGKFNFLVAVNGDAVRVELKSFFRR